MDSSTSAPTTDSQSSSQAISQGTAQAINKGQKRPQEDAAAKAEKRQTTQEARRKAREEERIARWQKLLTPEYLAEQDRFMKEVDERVKEQECIERLKTWDNLMTVDRTNFEEQLRSKSSAFYLERCPSQKRSHCRAQFCLPSMLSGQPNIESNYRFNLRDLTNTRTDPRAWWPRKPRCYLLNK